MERPQETMQSTIPKYLRREKGQRRVQERTAQEKAERGKQSAHPRNQANGTR